MDPASNLAARQHQYEKRQRRRDKIVLISLVEMLTIITFISVGMAFVTQQDVDLTRNWRLELEQVQEQRDSVRRELTEARATIERQERELAILWDAYFGQPLPPNAELRREALEGMRARGFGMPTCEQPHGLLLRVETFIGSDGSESFRANGAWGADESAVAQAIPGVSALIAAGNVSRSDWAPLANQIEQYGEAQPIGCRYRILHDEQHDNLQQYKSQNRFLQSFFRVNASE